MKRSVPLAVTMLSLFGHPAMAEWEIAGSTDRLDPKRSSAYAIVHADRGFEQFGRPIAVGFVVSCQPPSAIAGLYPAKLIGYFRFSDQVSIADRLVRWRIDQHPVSWSTRTFYGDGTTYYLNNEAMPQVRTGKLMRVEFDLPWAGNVLSEFKIAGAADAFTKIPCGGSAGPPKGTKQTPSTTPLPKQRPQ